MDTKTIQFGLPGKFWQTVGYLTDGTGNEFRVFVTGVYKQDVERATRLIETGRIRITAQCLPIDSNTFEPSPTPSETKERGALGGVRIGISRANILSQPPYRIRYEIDPEIFPPPQSEPLEFTFDGQDKADVLCEIRQGSVDVELLERDRNIGQVRNQRRRDIASATHPVEYHEPKKYSGNWIIRITGKDPSNYFTLKYDKVVT